MFVGFVGTFLLLVAGIFWLVGHLKSSRLRK
jgi:hypothetical protein